MHAALAPIEWVRARVHCNFASSGIQSINTFIAGRICEAEAMSRIGAAITFQDSRKEYFLIFGEDARTNILGILSMHGLSILCKNSQALTTAHFIYRSGLKAQSARFIF